MVQALCEDANGARESRQSLGERHERLAGCLGWYKWMKCRVDGERRVKVVEETAERVIDEVFRGVRKAEKKKKKKKKKKEKKQKKKQKQKKKSVGG